MQRSIPRFRSFWGIAALAAFVGLSLPTYGTHVSGIDINWQCQGGNSYLITMNLFRDCSGISMSSTEDIQVTSDCGQSFVITLSQGPGSGVEISQLCPPILPQSDCGNGGYPGMEAYNYQGIVTLNPPCDSWTISWSECCRNTSENVPNSLNDDMYAEAILNTATAPCNDSPVFTAQPIPFVCQFQPVSYNFGVYDPDGDSLVYTFVEARMDATTGLTYDPLYTPLQPIPGITLDQNTGAVTFTPTLIGNFIVVVQVEEFDANGNLIGVVMRDMQFTVISCTNIIPDGPLGYTNLSGDAQSTGPNSLELCLGDQFCLELLFNDGNPTDSLILTSNVDLVLPGATMVQTGVNPAMATICWTAVPGTSSLASFTVFAEDNACPVTGLSQATVFVTFLPTTVIDLNDTTLCYADNLAMFATGGNIFDWVVLSGPPMQVPGNFSCTPCEDPIATPIATTVYEVTSDLNGVNCVNKDTLTVVVVPEFGFTAVDLTNTTCFGYDDGEIAVEPWGQPGPPWTYELYENGILEQSETTNGNGTLEILTAGTYEVRLIEPFGCMHDTTVVIDQPDLLVTTTSDTTVCLSTTATISAQATGGTAPFTFSWDQGLVGSGPHQVGPWSPTSYTVFATDSEGCVSAAVVSDVNLYPPLNVSATAPDSICIDAGSQMSAIAGGGIGTPYDYLWTELGNGTIGNGDVIIYTPNGQVNTFIVTAADGCGTPSASDTVEVAWYPPPVPLVVPDITEDCFPAEITFTNMTAPADIGANCTWDFGDGNTGTGCNTVTNTFQNVGCYDITLTVYSPEGCPGTATFPQLVCARPYPNADFEWFPREPDVLDPEVAFLDRSTDQVSWAWSFGPLCLPDSAFEPNPVVLFPEDEEGDYPVWLHIENIYGCPDSIMHVVHINGLFFFYAPNAFSPDGDDVNDVFNVVGQGISEKEFLLEIYDRWGQVVGRATHPDEGWDGDLMGGAPASAGMYAWRAKVTDRYLARKKIYTGHVTLLR
ncbi:MAG: gliding motility-associated C-terminal domain-containing protein [Flavobacteriales bacterium]|nr:gliding motility-associated C-terminal domain-containing protein [Flavobacteriales bacterium]MBK9076227.1 gliding motility-associated C-terminal domain-containing protein [Flavobacteriales bacterium]MBK9540553.1 gliding motility-associated C-terminal domain-containing protein [Flavobacteriales bacterium]